MPDDKDIINQITEELKNEDLSPPDLVRIATTLSGWYSYYGQMLKRIHLLKPSVWLKIQATSGDKPLSDRKTERT